MALKIQQNGLQNWQHKLRKAFSRSTNLLEQLMERDNLSAVLKKKGELCLEVRPTPQPKRNEVLIAVHSVGICGSDVHYLVDGKIGDFVLNAPMVLGHESSGTVLKVGDGVTHLVPGDRVAMEPGVPCRTCEHCKTGRYNLCRDVQFFATPPVHGSLCRYVVHAADFCFKLPDNVSFEEGALLEPISVAVHACRRAGVTAGHKVLICGAGPIGVLNMMTARAMGATEICITDVMSSRLEFAKKMGANHILDSKGIAADDLVQDICKKFGTLPDITIECSGAETSITLAILATKPGGKAVMVGMGPPIVTIPLFHALSREVDILGIFRYANRYAAALDLVASGAIKAMPLITHRFKLEESVQAFDTAKTGAGGAIKVIINCQND